MAKKISVVEIAKTYLGSGLLLTATGYVVYFWTTGQAGWPVIVGFGIPALSGGLGLAARLWNMTSPDTKWIHPGSRSIPFTANGKRQGNIFMSATRLVFATKEQTATQTQGSIVKDEFLFFEPQMRAAIYENKLYTFCTVAWRRQRHASFGMLTANEVLSRRHFCTVYPRLSTADYNSIIHILASRELLDGGRWQGKGGNLRYPPHITVEEAKRRW